MYLIEINDSRGADLFLEVPKIIYKDDPNWIAPLRMDVENTFDPGKNTSFKNGDAIRWVLVDSEGLLIGRVAAFINHDKNRNAEHPTGGMGFFECINDQEAASILFDACVEWLSDKGAVGMDGSINFGENMFNWGVLVEGFMQQGYGMPYNKPYYKELFENYGFKDYYQQFSYHKDLSESFPERMLKFAGFLESRPGYSFEHFSFKNSRKYSDDMVYILNTTWEEYMEDYIPLEPDDMDGIIESAKPIMDEELIWYAYKDGRPIGVVVALPDFNQLFRHFNGRIRVWHLPKLFYLKKKGAISRFRVVMAGIIPEYQNSGAIAALFYQLVKKLKSKPQFTEMELSWVGDFNKRMRKIYEQIGGVQMKKHITYRYFFDKSIPFERFTNTGGDSDLRREALKKNK